MLSIMTRSALGYTKIFFILCSLGLTACQVVPPLNFSVADVTPSPVKIQADVKSITVALARADEQQGMMQAGQETLVPIWKGALEEALDHAAIFTDDAPTKISVGVKILKIDVPPFGIEFHTNTSASYEIINRKDGTIMYNRQIDSEGVVPPNFAFAGVARARESVNRSVQNNIRQFIQSLEKDPIVAASSPSVPTQSPGS